MTANRGQAEGELAAAISNTIVGALARTTGRGPTKAKTTLGENGVFVVLQDTLTLGERSLAEAGERAAVLDLRRRWQRVMQAEISGEVERLTGRRSHWAQLPLAIVFTTWALAILRPVDCAFIKWPPVFSAIVAVVSVSVTVGALYVLLRELSVPEPSTGDQYAKSPLGDAIRARIRRKLEARLVDDAIYKRSDLSLRALSEILNENPHYVSQIISQELNTTFYELVNRHRVEAAKRLLRERPDESVLSIAMDVGFNSKSAFHAAFRRCTGGTPSDFRASHHFPVCSKAPRCTIV